MLFLAAAVIAFMRPDAPLRPGTDHSAGHRTGSLIAEATATVRIMRGARITAASRPADAHLETVNLVGSDGQTRPARLVEFE